MFIMIKSVTAMHSTRRGLEVPPFTLQAALLYQLKAETLLMTTKVTLLKADLCFELKSDYLKTYNTMYK